MSQKKRKITNLKHKIMKDILETEIQQEAQSTGTGKSRR